ncbi:MAG: zinc ribbon domain-containing protein [Thermodesulfovibrionales bacterium]
MPIYEYKCKKCNTAFSVLQKTGTTEKDTVCPDCGSNVVKKLLSAFSCSAAGGDTFSPSASGRACGGGGGG